jgi:hypothetical protein
MKKLILFFILIFFANSAFAVSFVIPEINTKFDSLDTSIAAIEALADGKILMGNGSGAAAEVTPSGDVTMTNAGVNAIASGVIVNADVNASAAIDWSKMAALTDAQILVGNGSNVATDVAVSGDVTMANTGAVTIAAGAVEESMLEVPTTDALLVKRQARATYDFAVDGGATSSIGSGVTVPDNAIITSCWYDVVTTATSSGDLGTMAINLPTDGDLQAAVAINDGSNPYDAGLQECDTKGTDPGDPSTFLKTTAAREITWVIATEAFTAGKFQLFLEYVVSD